PTFSIATAPTQLSSFSLHDALPIYAELAEHALVEVLLDDLDAPVGLPEDVDRANLLELPCDLGVIRDPVVDFDLDEEAVQPLVRSEGTRLNSSHQIISYAVFCLKKK